MQRQGSTYFAFPQQAHHNAWLDVLRSLAIFLVLLRHGSGVAQGNPGEGFLANLLRNGWVGVDLFFVLSGYLIAAGLIRRSRRQEGSLVATSYFTDRILRIVPAYFAVLILCYLGFFPGFSPSASDPDRSLFAHLLFLQDYTGADINVVFWSLGVEEKFYLVAPLLVLGLARPRALSGCAALAACLLLVSPVCRAVAFEAMGASVDYGEFFRTLRSPFHMSIEGFVVGIFVAVLHSRGVVFPARHASLGLGLSALALLAWLGSHEFLLTITRFDAWVQPTALAALFGWMVWCAVSLGDRRPAFEPFFRVNARLSYALYLVHFPLLPLAAALAQDQGQGAFWAGYLALSYAAALVLHFAIEKAFMQLKPSRSENGPRPSRFSETEAVPS